MMLASTCTEACDSVADYRAWMDADTHIGGPIESWRSCFPHARGANVAYRCDLTHEDIMLLHGVRTLDMRWCDQQRIAGVFKHLAGVRVLNVEGCTQLTDEVCRGAVGLDKRHIPYALNPFTLFIGNDAL